MIRDDVMRQFVPLRLANVIGLAATPGQSVLPATCADAAWQVLFAEKMPELQELASPFVPPDPNRPIQVVPPHNGWRPQQGAGQ